MRVKGEQWKGEQFSPPSAPQTTLKIVQSNPLFFFDTKKAFALAEFNDFQKSCSEPDASHDPNECSAPLAVHIALHPINSHKFGCRCACAGLEFHLPPTGPTLEPSLDKWCQPANCAQPAHRGSDDRCSATSTTCKYMCALSSFVCGLNPLKVIVLPLTE